MESLEFSEDEIRNQLAALGYFNITEERMKQFRKDLHKLIEHDISESGSSSWYTGISSPTSTSGTSESFAAEKSKKPPLLSRFQPHIKVSPQLVSTAPAISGENSLWKTQLDNSRTLSQTAIFHQTVSGHSDVVQSSTDEMSMLLLKDVKHKKEPLQQIQTKSLCPDTSYRPLTKLDTSSLSDDYSSDSDLSTTRSATFGTKVVKKRKVLRKQVDGTPRVYDESLVEDSTHGLHRIHNTSVDDSDPRLSRVVPKHRLPPRPHSSKPMYRKDSSMEGSVSSDQPPSYIRPNTSHPHTRNLKKTDPVNRYHQYRDFWTNLKAPGEKSHKELRWEVKAQMMYKEEPAPKPQRVYVPNTYVVPTSKKRSALRWEVRHAMENGLSLPTTYDVY